MTVDCMEAADVDDESELILAVVIRRWNDQVVGILDAKPVSCGPDVCGPPLNPDCFPACDLL